MKFEDKKITNVHQLRKALEILKICKNKRNAGGDISIMSLR